MEGRRRIAGSPEGAKIDNDGELCEQVIRRHEEWLVTGADSGRLCFERNRGKTDMSVSHDTIYTWIYAPPKGELARAGIILRIGREQREPYGRKKSTGGKIAGWGPSASGRLRRRAARCPATGKAT